MWGSEAAFVLRCSSGDPGLLRSQGPFFSYQARALSPASLSGWPASEPHPRRKQQPLPSNSRILHSDRDSTINHFLRN